MKDDIDKAMDDDTKRAGLEELLKHTEAGHQFAVDVAMTLEPKVNGKHPLVVITGVMYALHLILDDWLTKMDKPLSDAELNLIAEVVIGAAKATAQQAIMAHAEDKALVDGISPPDKTKLS